MKHMKKIASLLLALAMILSLAVTAYADEAPEGDDAAEETYTITINGANEGHTYEAYQIFTGELHNGVLSNVQWGEGQSTHEKGTNAQDVASGLASQADALALADTLDLTDPTATSEYSDGVYTISGLPAGYYLVKDQDKTLDGKNAAYTDYIILVVGDAIATTKSSVPTIKKKVDDINDSTQQITDTNQDSADYDIGDHVPFNLHVQLNNHLSSYKSYKLVIHDTLSKGLTYDPGTMAVTLSGAVVDSSYYSIDPVVNADGTTSLTITFENIKPLNPREYADLILEYTATLNENAVIGSQGNPNTVYMEYSNNPSTDEMGRTKDDTVIVFTYQVVVNKVHKVEGENKPLAGAEFTLSKKIFGKEGWEVIDTIGGDTTKTFTFKGLDDGTYRLEETKTPDGYNTIAPIEFNIVAHHEIEADNPALLSLNGEINAGSVTFTSNTEDGSLSTDVINQAGATLPSTGGMGTTLFYVIGGVLVLAAVVLLVTKKRMGRAE